MKYTFITGAASGLGLEFAKIYARHGNNLILVDVNQDGLLKAKDEIKSFNKNIDIKLIESDLSNQDNLSNIYNQIKSNNIFINNVINAAGFGDREDFKNMNINKQLKLNHVNCDALLYFTHIFLNDMLKNNEGHIINISSIAGFVPGPFMSTYHASKAYVLLLGESISYELKNSNVKLLTLCPGPFNSNFVKEAHNDYTFKKIKPHSAAMVAELGYEKSIKGKRLYIVGLKNRLTVFITRFFPRKFVTKVSAKSMKQDA